jgi:hypothetical protein
MSLDGRGAPTVILQNKANKMAMMVKSTGEKLATYNIMDPYMVQPAIELATHGPKKALTVHLEGKDERIKIVFRKGKATLRLVHIPNFGTDNYIVSDVQNVSWTFEDCSEFNWAAKDGDEIENGCNVEGDESVEDTGAEKKGERMGRKKKKPPNVEFLAQSSA